MAGDAGDGMPAPAELGRALRIDDARGRYIEASRAPSPAG